MNKIKLLSAAVGVIAGTALFASQAFALPGGIGPERQGTGNGTAVLTPPLTITPGADLNFADVSYDPTIAGQVDLNTNGVATPSGGALAVGGTPTSGTFDITGIGTKNYLIGADASILLTCTTAATCGTDTVSIIDVVVRAGSLAESLGCTTAAPCLAQLAGGADTIFVGGSLIIPLGQSDGTYAGTYNVDVQYD